jgi:catechol 2,3-dioxygenase-like lactoylglutathione lyase family enzyme
MTFLFTIQLYIGCVQASGRKLMRFGHLHIQAKSVEDSAAFYAEHLGFKEVARRDNQAILQDESGLAFFIDASPTGEPIPESVHIGFRLDSPEEVRERYAAMKEKVDVLHDLEEKDGFSIFTLKDPDEMLVEVFYSVL